MEAEIKKLEAELEQLQGEVVLPENVSNSKKLQELSQSISQLESKIQKKYDRWGELEKK